jgi:hypothetical protein
MSGMLVEKEMQMNQKAPQERHVSRKRNASESESSLGAAC